MNPIRAAIDRPVAVVAGVLMIVMFGAIALASIPIQLAPDVNRPVITVETEWFGAAPAEVEREIINRQEEVLRGLEGLEEMTSRARTGEAEIELEFSVSQNMDRALLLVANRLDRVSGYPDEADEPTLSTAGSEDQPIAWFVIKRMAGNERPIWANGDFIEDVVRDAIERVPGVSRTNVYGAVERELQVVIDPERMARYRLTVTDIVQSLRAANASVSAGDVEEGKRRYVVRVEGDLETVERTAAVVVRSDEDAATGRLGRVTVADIAEVRVGYKEPQARLRHLGEPMIAMNAVRETGANVIETMEGIRGAVAELNRTQMPGQQLTITQVYDETTYIKSSIDLVQSNIMVGGTLAAIILLLFLRSARATLVVSIAIPVSVVGTFVAMAAFGRSLNVVSLAGIAFAVGMVVDAAIVVLENIYRLRQEGVPAREAAYRGASQVWGAVLVSALTTVMAFIPILITDLEVGQLFRDIAVAISVSVLLSLLVAVTLIPALSARLLGGRTGEAAGRVAVPGVDQFAGGFARGVIGLTRVNVRRRSLGLLMVLAVTSTAAICTWVFLPKLEYLPEGNRNFVFGIILPPPGYNLDTAEGIAERVETAVRPLWISETGPEEVAGAPPKIEHFFFVALNSRSFLGAASADPTRAAELIPVLRGPVFSEPGTFGFVTQPSIFGRGIGGGRSVNVDIMGNDLEQVLGVALRATGRVTQLLPADQGHQFRPIPGLELGAPEVRVYPDPVRLADNGLSARELGDTVDTFNDGLRVAEITHEGKRVDLTLRGPIDRVTETQGIAALPVVTRSGTILPAGSLAQVVVTAGPTEIQHKERLRTVTLEVRPAPGMALEAAMELLETEVLAPLRAEGLPPGVRMQLSGTADKLTETWDSLVVDLALAVAIVYLVMAVLFESFWYPLIILFSVPVAAAGGIAGLALLNLWVQQPLDMLTMLGFVILIGIVVNNAILLVDQAVQQVRQFGLTVVDAIREATRNRIRPIFMSTLTSLFGMMPLVLFPGAGSELYRGLGSVVVGGLALSSLLVLTLIPPLLGLVMPLIESAPRRRTADDADEAGVPGAVPQPAE